MRLPKIIESGLTSRADVSTKKSKRGSVAGVSCNPPVLKNTPFAFETPGTDDIGLAFGDQTFYLGNHISEANLDLSNLPQVQAIRAKEEVLAADVRPKDCVATNYTFADNQISPQYVLAPGQKLQSYSAPAGGYLGPLVWKLTPFLFDTPDGMMLANGTDSLSAQGSNLSAKDLPFQLALRPTSEFEPADGHIQNVTEQITLAPTNVAVILPAPIALSDEIAGYLDPSATPVLSVPPSATAAPAIPSSTHQGTSNGVIAGAVIGSLVGLALVGALGRVAYKKIQSLREDAKMGERMQQWAASRAIELAELSAAATQGDV